MIDTIGLRIRRSLGVRLRAALRDRHQQYGAGNQAHNGFPRVVAGAATLTQRYGRLIGTGARRVESVSKQLAGLGLEPVTDDLCTLLTIIRPFLREAVVHHVVALDANRVLNDPRRAVAVVTV